MKCEFSTTLEFQLRQIYYEMIYFKPNIMVGIKGIQKAKEL
jgi:hypothetical protein